MTTPLGPPQAPLRAQFSSSSLVAYSGLASDEAEDEEGVLGDFTARRGNVSPSQTIHAAFSLLLATVHFLPCE